MPSYNQTSYWDLSQTGIEVAFANQYIKHPFALNMLVLVLFPELEKSTHYLFHVLKYNLQVSLFLAQFLLK